MHQIPCLACTNQVNKADSDSDQEIIGPLLMFLGHRFLRQEHSAFFTEIDQPRILKLMRAQGQGVSSNLQVAA